MKTGGKRTIKRKGSNEPSLIGSSGVFPPGVTISHCGSPSSSPAIHSSSPSSKLPRGVSIEDSSEILEILLDRLGRRDEPGVMLEIESVNSSRRECARTMYIVCGDKEGDAPTVVLERERPLGLSAWPVPLTLGRGETLSIDTGERAIWPVVAWRLIGVR